MNHSEPEVVTNAEGVVNRKITNTLDRVEFMEQECRAVTYRERWRYIGVMLSIGILVLGMALAPRSGFVNVYWCVGAGLALVIGVMIGHIVYRRKAPW